MGKSLLIGLLVIALAVVAFFAVIVNRPQPTPSTSASPAPLTTQSPQPSSGLQSLTVDLDEQNESSQSGVAVLEEVDGQLVVMLSVSNAPKGVTQPAHIHAGSCPDVGAVVFPLESLVNGESETTLDTTLAALEAQAPLAINVHQSASEIQTYVACGDLPF